MAINEIRRERFQVVKPKWIEIAERREASTFLFANKIEKRFTAEEPNRLEEFRAKREGAGSGTGVARCR